MCRNHKRSLISSKRRQPVPWKQRMTEKQRLPLQDKPQAASIMDSMGQRFRTSHDLCLRNSLPRRFQPDTPEKQLDAVPELSCGELSEAGHRWPESNLKREVAWQTQIHSTPNAAANATLELVEAALIADFCDAALAN